MLKKIFWIAIAIYAALLILFNSSHKVDFSYLHGKDINLRLDLILIVSFAAGILAAWISSFIGKSQQFFLNILSYPKNKKKESLQSTFDKAVNYIKLENYKKGKELLLSYLKDEINNTDAYLYLADIYLKEDAAEDAEELLKRGSIVNKDNIKILNKLCDVYIGTKKFNKAIKLIEEIKEKVENKVFYNKRIYDIYVLTKDYKKACEIQKELEKDDSFKEYKKEFLVTRYNFAVNLIKEGKNTEAEKRLKNIIEDDKYFYGAYVDYAKILTKEGKDKEALDFLTSSYEKTKFPYFAKLISDIYLAKEEPKQALLFYQNQLDQFDDNMQSSQYNKFLVLYALYIKLLLRLEMIDFAIEAINDIIGMVEDKKVFHIFLAECYYRHQKYEESAKEYHEYFRGRGLYPVKLSCSKCEAEYDNFVAACTKCGNYNTMSYHVN